MFLLTRSAGLVLGGVILLLCALLRLRTGLRDRTVDPVLLGAGLGFLGVALLLMTEPVAHEINQFWGLRNGAVLVGFLSAVLCGYFTLEVSLRARGFGGRIGTLVRGMAAVAVLIVLSVLFVRGNPPVADALLFENWSGYPPLRWFWIVLISVLFIIAATIAVATWIDAQDQLGINRPSLRLIATGVTLMMTFLVERLVVLVWGSSAELTALAPVMVVLGCVLIVVGVSMPILARHRAKRLVRARLRMLWQETTAVVPGVREQNTPPHIYRAVVEIQDAVTISRGTKNVIQLLPRVNRALVILSVRGEAAVTDVAQDLRSPWLQVPA